MDDTVYRQAAINAINSHFGFNVEEEYGSAVQEVINSLPPAKLEPRWTPVEDKPPKAGVRYQVTFESGEVGYADFRNKIFLWDGSVKENVWEIDRYYEDDGEVIAWMPLPKPYERSDNVKIH